MQTQRRLVSGKSQVILPKVRLHTAVPNNHSTIVQYNSNQSINIAVLYHLCSSQNEAKTKAEILNLKSQKQRLAYELNCAVNQIFTNFEMFQCLESQMVRQQTQDRPSTVCIISNPQGFDLVLLQNIFNQYINNRKNILQKNYEGVFKTRMRRDQLNHQIVDLSSRNSDLYIDVLSERTVNSWTTYRIYMSFWISGENFEEAERRMVIYKNLIENLFQSEIKIILKDDQFRIWRYHLEKKYKKQFDISDIIIDQTAYIIIKGQLDSIQKAKQGIEREIKQYSYFELSFPINHQLLLSYMSLEIIGELNATLVQKISFQQNFSFFIKVVEEQIIVFRIVCDPKQLKLVSTIIQTQFVNELDILQTFDGIDLLLQYYGSSIQDFQKTYSIVSLYEENKLSIIGFRATLQSLLSLLDQFIHNQFPISNPVIFKHFAESYDYQQFNDQVFSYMNFYENYANVWCEKEGVDTFLQQISIQIHEFQRNLILDKFHTNFYHSLKEDKFRITQLQKETNSFFNFQSIYNFQFDLPQKENKTLILTNQDIFSIECDCQVILGQQNNILSEITRRIQSIKGKKSKTKFVKAGDETLFYTYQYDSQQNDLEEIDYQLQFEDNVFSVDCVYEDLKEYLNTIALKSQEMQFKSLAVYVDDNELGDIFIRQIADYFLLFTQANIQIVYISVLCKEKSFMDYETILAKQCLSLQNWGSNFQWQWKNDEDMYTDYDPQSNEKIEGFYQNYLTSKSSQQQNLTLPLTTLPGSHLIDLDQMQIKCNRNNQIKNIQLLSDSDNNIEYFIDDQQMEQEIQQHITQFKQDVMIPIFLTKYDIYIDDNEMFQKNIETEFKRKIRRMSRTYQSELNIISLSHQNNQQVSDKLDQYIQSLLQELTFELPELSDAQISEIRNQLNNKCWLINGQFQSGNQLQIRFISENYEEILELLNQYQIIFEQQ